MLCVRAVHGGGGDHRGSGSGALGVRSVAAAAAGPGARAHQPRLLPQRYCAEDRRVIHQQRSWTCAGDLSSLHRPLPACRVPSAYLRQQLPTPPSGMQILILYIKILEQPCKRAEAHYCLPLSFPNVVVPVASHRTVRVALVCATASKSPPPPRNDCISKSEAEELGRHGRSCSL